LIVLVFLKKLKKNKEENMFLSWSSRIFFFLESFDEKLLVNSGFIEVNTTQDYDVGRFFLMFYPQDINECECQR